MEYRDYGVFLDILLNREINPEKFNELYKELLVNYRVIMLQLKAQGPIIRLVPYVEKHHAIYKYRWALTATTFITVFLTGYGLTSSFLSLISQANTTRIIAESILYTATFLLALLAHELGHLFISRGELIEAEGPVLLPAPPIQLGFIGTFGAVIFTKTPPPTKKTLAELGIMGPIMGFIVATIVGLIGVYISPTIPLDVAVEAMASGEIQTLGFSSLMFYLLVNMRRVVDGVLLIHPVLFVAYIVYIVTFINLLPIGQLDGGHVVRSFTRGKIFNAMGLAVPVLLLSLGFILEVFYGIGGIYIGVGIASTILYLVTGRHGHPGSANQYDESHCGWCIILYILLLVLTAPIPIL
ncbi:MAG: site-2 protease family protein [Thermosphaera sp.]|nr:site-2 protease family protein [Thermosphaera sp.]